MNITAGILQIHNTNFFWRFNGGLNPLTSPLGTPVASAHEKMMLKYVDVLSASRSCTLAYASASAYAVSAVSTPSSEKLHTWKKITKLRPHTQYVAVAIKTKLNLFTWWIKILKVGLTIVTIYQPRRQLSKRHITNYTRFIREKAIFWKKI